MSRTSITFDSAGISLAGHYYVPDDDGAVPRPAIVVSHPGSGLKEQAAGLYAQRLADKGFVTEDQRRKDRHRLHREPRPQPSGRFPLTDSPNGAPRGVPTGGAGDPQHETDSPTPSTGPVVLRFGTAVPAPGEGNGAVPGHERAADPVGRAGGHLQHGALARLGRVPLRHRRDPAVDAGSVIK
jgi:hypothetical protein